MQMCIVLPRQRDKDVARRREITESESQDGFANEIALFSKCRSRQKVRKVRVFLGGQQDKAASSRV